MSEQKNPKKQKKQKNVPKNIQAEKSNLFAYLRFCGFCVRKEKRIQKRN